MSWLLSPYAQPRTYRVLLYLLLGLPLGVFSFVLAVTGLSLGLGLLVTVLGIPILVATLLLAQALATLERRLAWSLLDAPLPRLVTGHDDVGVFWTRLRRLITRRRTWAELAFALLRLPLGIVDFTVAVTVVGLMLQGVIEPILVLSGVETAIGSWRIDTVPESLVFLPVSALFVMVGPRLILGWGEVSTRVATTFLGRVESSELKVEIADVLARTGEVDAFRVLDELVLRLGRGPFLTPIRVEAALLALESNGQVRARRGERRTMYALT